MSALELVSDRTTKAPIDKARIGAVQEATYRSGTMIRVSGPNIILSPPLIVTEEDVTRILSDLATGLAAA